MTEDQLKEIEARAKAVLDARRAVRERAGVGRLPDHAAALQLAHGIADAEQAYLRDVTKEYNKNMDPSTTLALVEEVRRLRGALRAIDSEAEVALCMFDPENVRAAVLSIRQAAYHVGVQGGAWIWKGRAHSAD